MRESMIEPLQAMEVVQGEIGSDDPLIKNERESMIEPIIDNVPVAGKVSMDAQEKELRESLIEPIMQDPAYGL